MNRQKLKEMLKNTEGLRNPEMTFFKEILEALLNEPKAVDEPVKPVKWRAGKQRTYWTINHNLGDVSWNQEIGGIKDDFRYLTGNYYKTEEEAEQALEVIKAKGRLSHAYYALVGDWKPDWHNNAEKWYLIYEGVSRQMRFVYAVNSNSLNPYYFPTTELADQFIKENEKDLRLVFNINDND